ncbi:hypothetical protein J2TS4_32350 [Paenibacillus sp. J2TS4]|nr:hypothetical protein J2TS4_32350 [Paenibacillus sp. J2TS4]
MLYHFSEEADIELFIPRIKQNRPDMPAVVWAIDEDHAVNYFFPRDCPRVIYRRSDKMSIEDEERFFGQTAADIIIAVENGWLQTIQNTVLFKYVFSEEDFELYEPFAGYYISRRTVAPAAVERMDSLQNKVAELGVELRFTPNLYPLRNAILNSSVDYFSIIRFHNAAPPSTNPLHKLGQDQ